MENNDQSDSVTGWDYLSVQQFAHQTNVFLAVSFATAAPWPCCRSREKKKKRKKKQPSGNEERRERSIWWRMNFLMSREDPRTGSWGCRGARCSRSGRRRWRDRRCTWAEDDCLSDSEDTKRERSGHGGEVFGFIQLLSFIRWMTRRGLPAAALELWYYWSVTVCQFTSAVTLLLLFLQHNCVAVLQDCEKSD